MVLHRADVETAIGYPHQRICGLWLRQRGESGEHEICWDTINLQDEVDEAQAMLYREQAAYYRARAAAVKQ